MILTEFPDNSFGYIQVGKMARIITERQIYPITKIQGSYITINGKEIEWYKVVPEKTELQKSYQNI